MADGERNDHRDTPRRRSLFDPIGRIVDTVVPSVAGAVDVDDVVRRIDVDDVVGRVDIGAVVDRIDVDDVVRRIDVGDVVRRIDVGDVVRRIDVGDVVRRIDVDDVVRRIDVDDLIRRVDVQALVDRIDVDALLARVSINELLGRINVDSLISGIDLDAIIGRVSVDDVLSRIDVDALLDRVSINDLLDRIEVDRLLARVDIDAVMSRVDIDAVVDRVDVDRIVQRADLAGVVAQSTRGITASTLDLVRRQIVGVDEIITRVAARVVRRDPDTDPDGPAALIDLPQPARRGRERPSITGHYAGPVARVAALGLDWVTMVFLFGVFTAMAGWMIDLLFDRDVLDATIAPIWSAVLLGGWAFIYFTVPLALTGRTFGKAVVGLRVVGRDAAPLRVGQAIVRVLVLPVSFLILGLGLVGAVFGRHRRTLHDVAARSVRGDRLG